jgi:hypothetical protein
VKVIRDLGCVISFVLSCLMTQCSVNSWLQWFKSIWYQVNGNNPALATPLGKKTLETSAIRSNAHRTIRWIISTEVPVAHFLYKMKRGEG